MIRADVRSRLTANDLHLVLLLLSRGSAVARERLERQLAAEGPDTLLDHPELLDRLLAVRTMLVPSEALFYYVLVRRALLDADVDDRGVSDYLGALLLEFGRRDRAWRVDWNDDHSHRYLVDILADLEASDGERRFRVMGNVEELQRALNLPGLPNRIEGYDISNIQGTEQVGSLVVWENGGLKKDDYKRFRIRSVAGADDFASLREVLGRRFAKALEQGGVLPDLVLIDGGRGQLNAGLKALQDLGLDWIPVAALAKRQEEVYVNESLHPLVLDPTSPALHTLQKIRDEAHRFAITYHKKLRARRTLQSELDAIAGVGPTIRTSLLKTLGSARRVRESSVAELAAVPKVTPKLAQRIFAHFHPASVEPETAAGC